MLQKMTLPSLGISLPGAVPVVLAAALVLICPVEGLADTSPGSISQLVETFYTRTASWGGTLQSFAFALLRWTLILEVCLFGVRMALQRAQIADIMGQFVMILLFAGFIAAVIKNYDAWSWSLINGLAATADGLGASRTTVEAPFMTGCAIVMTILDKLSITSPVDSLAYIVAALVVLIAFALMTAQILFVKCEAMIAMNASVILLGLGGSAIFREYAINVMRYVLAVAFKLFVMQLLLGLALTFIADLELAEATMQDIFVVIGVAVIILALVRAIPEACAGIINGSHVHGGQALGATAGAVLGAAVGGAAGAAAATAGTAVGVKSVSAASQLAKESGATGLGRFGHMAGNLYSAYAQARAESPRAGYGLRLNSRLQSRLQAKKMENAMKEQDHVE